MSSDSPFACQVGESSEVASTVLYVQSDMCEMEGKSVSDNDVKEHCDGNRLIRVKEELPDAISSASSDDEVGQERFTHDAVKQEVSVSIVLYV